MDGPMIICGAGIDGRCAMHYLRFHDYNPVAFYDHDVNKWGKCIEGLRVCSADEIKKDFGFVMFVLAGRHCDEIYADLVRQGIGKNFYLYSPDITRLGGEEYSFDVPKAFFQDIRDSIVYSFGIGEDLSFSEEILKMSDHIDIFAFDPTPKSIKYVMTHPVCNNKSFHFQGWGISNVDKEVTFYLPKNDNYVSGSIEMHDGVSKRKSIRIPVKKLKTIMSEMGHDRIDLLKLDVEGAEFSVITDIIEDGIRPKYICMEIHERFFEKSEEIKCELIQSMVRYGYWNVCAKGNEYLFSRLHMNEALKLYRTGGN